MLLEVSANLNQQYERGNQSREFRNTYKYPCHPYTPARGYHHAFWTSSALASALANLLATALSLCTRSPTLSPALNLGTPNPSPHFSTFVLRPPQAPIPQCPAPPPPALPLWPHILTLCTRCNFFM